jgi:tetratricopeptide (TPR) repeat protein
LNKKKDIWGKYMGPVKYKSLIVAVVSIISFASVAEARIVGIGPGEQSDSSFTQYIKQESAAVVGSIQQAREKVILRLTSFFSSPSKNEVNLPMTTVKRSLSSELPSGPQVSMATVANEIKHSYPMKVKVAAVPYKDKNLILSHNGIPVFEFKKFKAKSQKSKIRHVPLLNLWSEPELEVGSIKELNVSPIQVLSFVAIPELKTPVVLSQNEFLKNIYGENVVAAKPTEHLEIPFLEEDQKVTSEKILKLVYKLDQVSAFQEMPTVAFLSDDLKLLRGLILFEKKDQCHIASGIFSDLINQTQSEDVKLQSRYLLGICLHEMNLPTEALFNLKKVIRSGDERYLKAAIKAAVEDLPSHYESEVGEALNTLKSDSLIPEESRSTVAYIRAKFFIKHEQPQKALDQALKVPTKNNNYYKAQYLASVAEYELGKLDAAMERERSLAAELMHKGSNKDILALIQVNLGRVAFEKGRYRDSLDAFQHVPKEHPLWLQALTEQAWTQLQSKDAAGAIGNMHSIQSPYFDGVFKPESYIVRTIGYLNICQYADAYKALAHLEHFYVPWLQKIQDFNKSQKDPYLLVLKQLQSKGVGDIDGLPFQVIREAARQRDFLNVQEGVNQLIDETGGYGFVKSLIEKDKRSLLARRNAAIAKVGQLKLKIKNAHSVPNAMKDFNAWRFELANYEDFLSVYEFKVQTLKEGFEGFDKLQPQATERIVIQKTALKKTASDVLNKHLIKMAADLKQNLESNELLKYEIYSGSGENLRYKVAGGKIGAVGQAGVDRHPSGSQKWDFSGEFWEDEIGNYRSSIKSNCQASASQTTTAREAK